MPWPSWFLAPPVNIATCRPLVLPASRVDVPAAAHLCDRDLALAPAAAAARPPPPLSRHLDAGGAYFAALPPPRAH
jgi:hypothetical protein